MGMEYQEMKPFEFVDLDGQKCEVYVIAKSASNECTRVAIDVYVPEKNSWYGPDLDIAGVDALIAALTAARDEAKRLNEGNGG